MARVPVALVAALIAGSAVSCRPAVDPGPPLPETRLRMRTQPANVQVGVPMAVPPVVEVIDPSNQLTTRPGMTVRAQVISGQGQISGGAEVPVVAGLATFSSLTIVGTAQSNIRLGFQLFENDISNVDAVVAADTFRLARGPAATITPNSTVSFQGSPGQTATPTPSVVVKDIAGNVVPGMTVTFSITAGEGRITGASQATSDEQGVATVSGWVLGLPGQNQLKAVMTQFQEVFFNATVSSTTGMLRIRLNNAPAGATAKLRVLKTSAAGTVYDAIHEVNDSLTITGIPFGTYQVSGDSVKVGARLWQADATIQGLNVSANSGPSIVINYREYGRFEITARGLPNPNQSAVIDFLATGGESALTFNFTALNDAITRGLGPVGTYNVVPRTVSVAGQQFTSSPPQQSVVLAGGDAPVQMTFNYGVVTGTLVLTIAGTLPAGAAPQIDVTGPAGFHETVFVSTPSRTWTGLTPGSYTITASQINVANVLYRPTPGTTTVTVTAGGSTPVTITYNP